MGRSANTSKARIFRGTMLSSQFANFNRNVPSAANTNANTNTNTNANANTNTNTNANANANTNANTNTNTNTNKYKYKMQIQIQIPAAGESVLLGGSLTRGCRGTPAADQQELAAEMCLISNINTSKN